MDRNVPIRAAQVTPEFGYQAEDEYILDYADYNQVLDQDDPDLTFHTDIYSATVMAADNIEHQDGRCFNCKEAGHFWRECPKPLKEEFKHIRDHPCQCQDELNGKGGPGKGG